MSQRGGQDPVLGGGQGGCERRIEVIVEMQKKIGGGGGFRSGWVGGSRDGVGRGGRGLVGSKVGDRGLEKKETKKN